MNRTDPLTFEEWKETVRFRGTLGSGSGWTDRYGVGERVSPLTLVGDEEALAYFERHVATDGTLTIHNGQRQPGDPAIGSFYNKRAVLTYCIDRAGLRDVVSRHSFLPPGTDLYPIVDYAFGAAAAAWNRVAGISITKDVGRDESCSAQPNDNITWYVRPFIQPDPNAVEFLTFVLRPHHNALSWENHDFLIWEELLVEFSFPDPTPFGDWFSLEGLMLNTIGTGLGFIDESNRGGVPGDSGETYWPSACRDSSIGGIFMSEADPYSVMTHPEAMANDGALANADCAGNRERDYAITYWDAMGAACQYRGAHELYYCSSWGQNAVRNTAPEICSPVPVVTGLNGGDCGPPIAWEAFAAPFSAALLAAAAG